MLHRLHRSSSPMAPITPLVSAVGAALLLAGPAASATTIDFGALAGAPPLDPFESLSEDGYTVDVVTGPGLKTWSKLSGFGSPAPAVGTAAIGASSLVVTKVGGGDFLFDSIDLTTVARSASTTHFTLVGDLFGAQQFTQSGSLSGIGPLTAFSTISSVAPTVAINRLTINFLQTSGMGSGTVDNIVLLPATAAVPEPSAMLLAVLGGAGVLLTARRRRQV